MRLFFIGWGDYVPETIDAVEELQRHHDIVYWTRSSACMPMPASRFPRTIFHELDDALCLRPAQGVPSDSFDPPSPALLAKLYETESIVLTNMNKKFERVSTTERKRVYYEMVRYWHGVLLAYRPDAIIFTFIPHTVYDYILYGLAKELGVKTLLFNETMIEDWMMLVEEYTSGYVPLQKEIRRTGGMQFSLHDLSPAMREYYRKKTDRDRDATPLYMLQDYRRFSGASLVKKKMRAVAYAMASGSFVRSTVRFLRKKITASDLRMEYRRVEKRPDTGVPYVYVALNYQPECTTSPQGGVFVDQILMIETLAAALPSGWSIYVKEHPYQWMPRGTNYSPYRYPGFYETIVRIPGVSLVPVETSSYHLTDHAKAVVTVTGTPGWEAILRGVPALMFGFAWYQDFPQIFKIRSVADVRAAFQRIAEGFTPTRDEVIRFLVCLERTAFRGNIDGYTAGVTHLSKEENKATIVKAILTALG